MSLRIGLRKEDKNEWEPPRGAHAPGRGSPSRRSGLKHRQAESFPRRAYSRSSAYADEPACRSWGRSPALRPGPRSEGDARWASFREGGAYMFFSHTIKGQPYNMPMLAELVEKTVQPCWTTSWSPTTRAGA